MEKVTKFSITYYLGYIEEYHNLFMDEQYRKINLIHVYRHDEGSLSQHTEINRYYSVLQERIRRECNKNNHPNPFKIDPVNNSDEISLDSTYDEKLSCIKKWIENTVCIIPDLQHTLLEWTDRMSASSIT